MQTHFTAKTKIKIKDMKPGIIISTIDPADELIQTIREENPSEA